jgi:site-specific DNA-methyltransferase (adenine-specific)
MKALYYGGNFQALRDRIATESVDLIYLDPPFNSNATLGRAVVCCWG